MCRDTLLILLCLLPTSVYAQDIPKVHDTRLVVTKFAAAPDIVQPIALDFDAKRRLLVVESHTHFRPNDYQGPKFDRIRILEDTNGDGQADKFTTFYEGTTATMDLATHPDGTVFVATRNEILRLRDGDGDGQADDVKRVVFLDTKGNYPHNGLSGLSFDTKGNLYFGMGENLGEGYKLSGTDETTLTGGGEGGNLYHVNADGSKLRRLATGFWNPFGTGRDIFGRVFIVDNDPDASPPCRLLQLQMNADYGYQFRYGRSGRHPFQAWNGELPGTLPMVAGTGESPCEVLSYESDGLPAEYRGQLLVPAWADHRVERYELQPSGAGHKAERKPFISGGKEFRPSGLTVAPDGSLFVSDWVSQSYPLHGKGAIWHVRWKDAPKPVRPTKPEDALLSHHRPLREAAAATLAKDDTGKAILRKHLAAADVRVRATALTALTDANDTTLDVAAIARTDKDAGVRELAVRALIAAGKDVKEFGKSADAAVRVLAYQHASRAELLLLATEGDPYARHAAIQQLAQQGPALLQLEATKLPDPKQRLALLLALRASGHAAATKQLRAWLEDTDPTVRLLVAKWIADDRLRDYRDAVVAALASPTLDSRGVVGMATTLARLDDKPVNEDALAGYFVERLNDPKATAVQRLQALRAIPSASKRLPLERVLSLLADADEGLKIEALRVLKDRGDIKALTPVKEVASDETQPLNVRAQALVTWAALGTPPMETLLRWATDSEPLMSGEALRALAQTKLSPEQNTQLEKVFPNTKARYAMVQRILGKPLHTDRPASKDVEAWLKRLEGETNPERGRRIFENSKVANCSRCHRVDGRGADVGPDLSTIGRTERRWLLESILQPSNSVAPHYQAWQIVTKDGKPRTGLLVHTQLDEATYVDPSGNRFKVQTNDIDELTAAKESIMPANLVDGLTDQELRDLLAYLESRR